MSIVIIRYNAGNTASVQYALARLGAEAIISDEPTVIQRASKIILPGVGAAETAMQRLRETGLAELLPQLTQPVLGICLGMQLLCRYSEEGQVFCLNIIDADVRRFHGVGKVPHTGWNHLFQLRGPLFRQVPEHSHAYFVHSYRAATELQTNCQADYMGAFSAGLQHNNFYGLQFHPEKSGAIGTQILKNFLSL